MIYLRYMLQTDMQVRDKILALLDSWQEAFGGPGGGGKCPQFFWAYDELRVSIFIRRLFLIQGYFTLNWDFILLYVTTHNWGLEV